MQHISRADDELGSEYAHRLNEYIVCLLDMRPSLSSVPPNTILWQYPTPEVANILQDDPGANNRILVSLGAEAQVPPNIEDPESNLNEIEEEEIAPFEADSGDEEEVAVVAQQVELESADLGGVFDDREAPETSAAQDIPSLRCLWHARTAKRPQLPPISMLFDALGAQVQSQRPAVEPNDRPASYEAWSIVRKSLSALSTASRRERLPMDRNARSVRGIPIDTAALKTLDAGRILATPVIAAFGELLLADHDSFPLLEGQHRPTVWVAPTGAAHLTPKLMLDLFFVSISSGCRIPMLPVAQTNILMP